MRTTKSTPLRLWVSGKLLNPIEGTIDEEAPNENERPIYEAPTTFLNQLYIDQLRLSVPSINFKENSQMYHPILIIWVQNMGTHQ